MKNKILGTIGIFLLTPILLLGILLTVMGFVEKMYFMAVVGCIIWGICTYGLVMIKVKCFPIATKDTTKPKSRTQTVFSSPNINFPFQINFSLPNFRKPSFSFNKPPYRVNSFEKERIKEINQKIRSSILSSHGLTPNEIYFLSYAPKFSVYQTDFQKFWLYEMGIVNPQKLLNRLESEGFIKPASASESLKSLKVSEIRQMLTELHIYSAGKKDDLIDRLCNTAPEDYLDSKVTVRNYSLTDLGNIELSENEYVVYFGRSYKYGFDIWSMNKALCGNLSIPFRDIIYKKLKQQMSIAEEEKDNGDYDNYVNVINEYGNFMLEKGQYSEALHCFAEAIYYTITVNAVERYRKELEYTSKKINDPLNFEYFSQFCEQKIINTQEHLCISNEELYFQLLEIFYELEIPETANFAFIPKNILNDEDVASLVMYRLEDNEEAVKELCLKAEQKLKKCKLPVYYFNTHP